jgi:hypothetical protein
MEEQKNPSENNFHLWEPELVISGVAIYITSQLPDLFHKYSDYFLENIFHGWGVELVNPIFAFLLTIAYILKISFISHFILRSIWVGYLGLIQAFPNGIIWENIKKTSDFEKEEYKKILPTTQELSITLDNWSSLIFSICIFTILSLISPILISILFLFLGFILRIFSINNQYLLITFLLAFLIILIISLITYTISHTYLNHKPKYQKINHQLKLILMNLYFPFFGKIYTHFLFIFTSNFTAKKIITTYYIVMSFFIIYSYFDYFTKHRPIILQNYISSTKIDSIWVKNNQYEKLRQEGEPIQFASIQSDIITEPFVKLFVVYRKEYDTYLNDFCKNDSISKYKCFQESITVLLNHSKVNQLDGLFYVHPQTEERGVLFYLPTNDLPIGKNMIKLKLPLIGKKDSIKIVHLPFWYGKSNNN